MQWMRCIFDSFEAGCSWIHFLASRLREGVVEMGLSAFDPPSTGTSLQQGHVQIPDDHIVGGFPGLCDDASITVDKHRIARSHLIIINSHSVAEDQEHAVVVGPGRQPAHEPSTPFVPFELPLNNLGLLAAAMPQVGFDLPHRKGTSGVGSSRLMRSEQNIGTLQSGGSGILNDVVVVADQNTDFMTQGAVKYGVVLAGLHMFTDEAVNLPMVMNGAVYITDDKGVVERSV